MYLYMLQSCYTCLTFVVPVVLFGTFSSAGHGIVASAVMTSNSQRFLCAPGRAGWPGCRCEAQIIATSCRVFLFDAHMLHLFRETIIVAIGSIAYMLPTTFCPAEEIIDGRCRTQRIQLQPSTWQSVFPC